MLSGGAFPLSSSQVSSMVYSATFLLAAASKSVAEQNMLDASKSFYNGIAILFCVTGLSKFISAASFSKYLMILSFY